jgi:hypothetical protein
MERRASGTVDMFLIEDEAHAEQQPGEFATLADAISELKRRAAIPWDAEPNRAPCTNWRSCGRRYEIIEYDTATRPWKELQRLPGMNIRATGLNWHV